VFVLIGGAVDIFLTFLLLPSLSALTLLGVGIGVTASVFLTRLLAGLLFGVRALDPIAFTSAVLILVGAASLACYLPARRATGMDPVVVLRFQ
jgi:ABC-type antimicrobial peptide transport system permease subunit